jgi:hypothetical protein
MGNSPGSNPFQNFINWLLSLFTSKPQQLPPLTMPRKVLVIVFRPPGPKFQARSAPWSDPNTLVAQYIAKMAQVSGGQLSYQVTDTKTGNYFPVLKDGRCYDDNSWDQAIAKDALAFRDPVSHQYELVDVARILSDFNVLPSIKDGSLDEVWLFGGPLFGFPESCMVGRNAIWCNGDPVQEDTPRFVVMGFSYERSVKEMVHDYGHRVESLLTAHFGSDLVLQAMYPKGLKDTDPLPPVNTFPAAKDAFDQFLLDHGTVHRTIGGVAYSQDEAAWLTAIQPDWWPPTIDPQRV